MNEGLQKLIELNEKTPFVLGNSIDFQGWNYDGDAFEFAVGATRPKLVFEVGSWKGTSTIAFCKLILGHGIFDFKIVAIDTWLGGVEHILDDDYIQDVPSLYDTFRTNIHGLQNFEGVLMDEFIIPFRQTSANAARILKKMGLVADLIYIDASHEYEDVISDLTMYWEILRDGGIMFGDDCKMLGVKKALDEFCERNNLQPTFFPTLYSIEVANGEDVHWLLQKG